ncbi:MAG TPA: type III polyketide synthase, partial [Thermoanaerobaculia bacterium]|nr:type III polyketide synthase [Thermoanaerobaculia bacterium]
MKIAAVGRALPPHYYDQDALLDGLRRRWSDRLFNPERLERLHRNALVGGRHLALPIDEYAGLTTWGKANDAWIRVAQEVGGAAVSDALARAGLSPAAVDALIFVTVTGVA